MLGGAVAVVVMVVVAAREEGPEASASAPAAAAQQTGCCQRPGRTYPWMGCSLLRDSRHHSTAARLVEHTPARE